MRRSWRVLALIPIAALVGLRAFGDPAAPAKYAQVDTKRLMAADSEPGNWMTSGRDFGQGHFSPLTEINRDTVKRLGFAWDYDTGTTRGFEATPIVVDGVLYTSGVAGRVYALDAKTGKALWTFDPQADGQVNRYGCCDAVNRGVAVWEGMVYVASLDGRMFGLDAKTGKVVWNADTIVDKSRGYTSTGAPQVAGSVVVIGNAGADYDARGYVSAYDLKTGALRWRFFAVPGDLKKGFEHPELRMAARTWDPDSRWDVGGGGTPWGGMGYDPKLNLLYVGTGNAALYNWHERSPKGGDNLFLASILALNPDTGRLVWYYQEVPRDSWDYTATAPFILADLKLKGENRKVLMHAPKDGFFYILDRKTGKLLSADKYVPMNWATKVDLKTGRPEITAAADYDYGDKPKFIAPSGMGGHSWNPMAYDPDTGLVYIPTIEGGSLVWDRTKGHVYRPKTANSGNQIFFGDMLMFDPARFPEPMRSALVDVQKSGEAQSFSALKAFDPQTGKVVWEKRTTQWWDRGGVLATAGGLLFQGTDDGHFRVLDIRDGTVLKDIFVGTSIMAAPMTYTIDGVQYVAVMAAWGGGGWAMPHQTSAVTTYGNEGRIIAFKLDGGAVPIPPVVAPPPPIPEPPKQIGSADDIAKGGQLYGGTCGLCHANVSNGMTPDLRRLSPATHAAFKDIVLHGALRAAGMPQWDDVLSEKDVDDIHAYVIDEAWRAYRTQQTGTKDMSTPLASPMAH